MAYYVLGGTTQVYFSADGVTFSLVKPDAGGSRGCDGRGEAFLARSVATPDLPPDATRAVAAGPSRNASPLRDGERDPGNGATAPRQRWTVKLDFVGANPHARPVGENQTEAIVSYFKGAPDQWRAGLPTYARVVYRDLWPGIDVAFYGQAGRLKYDFVVHSGADPAQIRLRYRGADSVSLNAAGQMAVNTPLGGFMDDAPVAWQEIDGQRAPVPVAFDLDAHQATRTTQYAALASALSRDPGDRSGSSKIPRFSGRNPGRSAAHLPRLAPEAVPGSAGVSYQPSAIGHSQSFGFSLAAYDRSQPLVIDPVVLLYCGYIGGSGGDYGSGIAVDGDGNAYVTGSTASTQDTFPVTVGPDLTYNDGSDAFVAKVSASGAALVYAGYIGGSGNDGGGDIAVDGAGNAYVTGTTTSTENSFPVTGGPDLIFNGYNDAFVAKVSASGAALVYAGYIGGSGGDYGWRIAVDDAANAYVAGGTGSDQTTFPVTGGPDPTHNGGDDAFVAKVSASGTALVYAGYIGGSYYDFGLGIAVDDAGNAYVTGWTGSPQDTFPVTGGPDLTHNGGWDAFVAEVSASGAALVYAGYIGGLDTDWGWNIAVDDAGNAYVTGGTGSDQTTFPVTGGPDPTFNGGDDDAFVAKVVVVLDKHIYLSLAVRGN